MLERERILEILESLPRLPPVHDQMELFKQVTLVLQAEPNVLEVEAPFSIIGDVHGEFEDLRYCVLNSLSQPRFVELGDVVDRGPMSLECLLLLCGLKVLNPLRVFLLRGNHEEDAEARLYGFYDEVQRKAATRVYAVALRVFEALPVAAVARITVKCAAETVGAVDWAVPRSWLSRNAIEEPQQKPQPELVALSAASVFLTHGGIAQEFMHIRDINKTSRFSPALNALLWPDPDAQVQMFGPSRRGNGENFGADAARQFCADNDVELIIRAHQFQDDGFSVFADCVATVWSAANYCGRCQNLGAYAVFRSDGGLIVHRFESQHIERIESQGDEVAWNVDYFL